MIVFYKPCPDVHRLHHCSVKKFINIKVCDGFVLPLPDWLNLKPSSLVFIQTCLSWIKFNLASPSCLSISTVTTEAGVHAIFFFFFFI